MKSVFNTGRLSIVLLAAALVLVPGCGPGPTDYSFAVAGSYMVYRTSAHDITIRPFGASNHSDIIPAKVVKVAWNDRYVIAEQQGLKRAYPNNPNNTYEIPDNVFYYWILDAEARKAYGPYDRQTFEHTKQEFKIPASLELKDVASYKHD